MQGAHVVRTATAGVNIPELSDVSLLEEPPASPCTSNQSSRLNMLPDAVAVAWVGVKLSASSVKQCLEPVLIFVKKHSL
jgi:hypothetical protein